MQETPVGAAADLLKAPRARLGAPRDDASPGTVAVPRLRADSEAPRWAFWMLVTLLVLEFARPPGIVQLKLQLLISLALPFLFLASRRRPWSPMLTAQVLFIALCALSIPIASNWYAAYFVTRTMYGNVATAIGILWVCSSLRNFRRIVWLWVAIMSYQGVHAILHGGVGTGGFLGDENDLALACGTAMPLAFFGTLQLRGAKRVLSLLALTILLSAIVASFSRGGFVGLVAATGYCWWNSKHRIVSLAAVVLVALAVLRLAPAGYLGEIESISKTDQGTAETRRFLWASAFNMWKAHPLLGVGAGNTVFLIGKYQPDDFDRPEYLERDWTGTAVHSMYFQILPEEGTLGVAILIYLVWRHFALLGRLRAEAARTRRVRRALRRDVELYSRGLSGALIGFLASGAFLAVAYYPYLWYLTAFAAALDLAVRREMRAGRRRAERRALAMMVPASQEGPERRPT